MFGSMGIGRKDLNMLKKMLVGRYEPAVPINREPELIVQVSTKDGNPTEQTKGKLE